MQLRLRRRHRHDRRRFWGVRSAPSYRGRIGATVPLRGGTPGEVLYEAEWDGPVPRTTGITASPQSNCASPGKSPKGRDASPHTASRRQPDKPEGLWIRGEQLRCRAAVVLTGVAFLFLAMASMSRCRNHL
jgi:hypothetical protein